MPPLVYYTNRRARVHKTRQLTTPSLRFPLLAGGTEPLRVPLAKRGEPMRPTRFPSRSGGNLKEGGNCELWLRSWYYTNRADRIHKLLRVQLV